MRLTLNLLVLRCSDVEITRQFYEQLGFSFVEEKHGAGPRHYASQHGEFVLELYPLTSDHPPDKVRLGFSTQSLAEISGNHGANIKVLKEPHATLDRLIMVLEDPDGRKVEVSQTLQH